MQKSYERNNNFYAAVAAGGTSMQKDRSPLSDTNFRLQAVQAICIGERLFSVGVGILQLDVQPTKV